MGRTKLDEAYIFKVNIKVRLFDVSIGFKIM